MHAATVLMVMGIKWMVAAKVVQRGRQAVEPGALTVHTLSTRGSAGVGVGGGARMVWWAGPHPSSASLESIKDA